jgi:single-strand selective monofunctional uracil DNA glycosylase
VSLIEISRQLSRRVARLHFAAPVTHVYNPLVYARAPHERYLERFGAAPKQALLLGMNPGPYGMAQTGVPFGEIALVRDWMGICEPVQSPKREHPKRPVQGFECSRSEVSGARLWGWARDRFETPERFFEQFFVVNYCPLCFMEESGKNFTPDKLPKEERALLFAACDAAVVAAVRELRPEWVIGVGAFAEKAAARALTDETVKIGTVLHPSPASPRANRGWARQAEADLLALGIGLPAKGRR